MASQDTTSVLRRMLAQAPTQGASGVAAPFKPFASLVEKLADRSLSLPLGVASVTQTTLSRDAVLANFGPPALMLRLRSAAGGVGMAGLCPQLRAALIEVQTTGKVATTPPPDRPATDADAAICSGFIGDLIAQANAGLAREPTTAWNTVFTPAGRFESQRAFALALEDTPLCHLSLQLDLGGGARQGVLQLLIPQPAPRASAKPTGGWKDAMQHAVNDAPVPLEAVLHRMVVSLADVEALKVGDMLTLPRTAAATIMLEATETSVGPFKLGQISGQKALRRVIDPQPADPAPQPAPTLTDPAEPLLAEAPQTST
ncbi:FliM/FliN family flagellar motor switch protein [Cognatishimia sp. MH4019]|uniref:FliM/FliN family flagellar motor switch protein n=1 Tax=Cognatishimia sp. MH4019 TaxID=2854030 RepID=UPI001CD5194C|nr:FliM/FliN family flagellar motor switch protein [Cognatishimia sp. MH4019]